MKRSKRFYVISEKCVGCGACKTICKVHAISKGNPYTINENKCTGCGLCVTRCWRDVITVKQRAAD
ncbi:ATP-binding protein [Cellulosilyticum ruminicola]|uniref:ATP-binding protein n=1 Tax=Cellulosilyticum ruminicola TaxID=425254 RepID=UPI0006CF6CD8|nr:4Fe-4S binding protein [Cellulosilyticum ruminicola]